MNSPVRAGIIGSGFISNYHIAGLQGAGAEVVSVCSLELEQARKRAEQYGIADSTDSVPEILSRPDIDLIVIATPDNTHRDLAIQASRAGKPILLQKPMARTSGQAEEVLAASKAAGVPLIVSFMHRYFEEVVQVREMLKSGVLGNILMIRHRNATPGADWADWFYKKNDAGGVVMQLGIHGIDLLRYLFGEIEAVAAVTKITASSRTLADGTVVVPENEDLAVATYQLGAGAIATHEMSYREIAGTDRFRMEIYGENGTAWLRTERGLLSTAVMDQAGSVIWKTHDLQDYPEGVRHHRHVIAMVTGEEPIDTSAEDGVASLRVAEAIYQRSDSNT